jgi:hypothetical protein
LSGRGTSAEAAHGITPKGRVPCLGCRHAGGSRLPHAPARARLQRWYKRQKRTPQRVHARTTAHKHRYANASPEPLLRRRLFDIA